LIARSVAEKGKDMKFEKKFVLLHSVGASLAVGDRFMFLQEECCDLLEQRR
jgi:hypothetical protein